MKSTTQFACSECGYTSSKWLGKCPHCGTWNSFEEQEREVEAPSKASVRRTSFLGDTDAVLLDNAEIPDYIRTDTGTDELNRVLGGGLVDGSVVLLCGEPGIGKSTLLMQICAKLGSGGDVLYVSGEESQGQLKLRAKRLGVRSPSLYVLTETNVEKILSQAERLKPRVMIIDSVQTMYIDKISSTPGSVTQVKESALCFINKAKSEGISIVLVGHVNKEGAIAGPKVLEHMVDAVLYFEGERQQSVRIIRAIKNRFGSTNEIGVFEMTDKGLCEVPNPSEMLLRGRPVGVSGNCAVCVMEGSRPILAEIQALVTPSYYTSPRRTASGMDLNRVCLILALLEKRLGLRYSTADAYINVIGGLRIDEPASDLALALSLASSLRDQPLPDDTAIIGELGLAGECRGVSCIEQRVRECARLGFSRVMVPYRNFEDKVPDFGVELKLVRGIFDAVNILGGKG